MTPLIRLVGRLFIGLMQPSLLEANEAPTEVAPSINARVEGPTHSVPETPHIDPEHGCVTSDRRCIWSSHTH